MTTPTRIARYVVLNPLEAGGMGQVLLARDPAIDRLVAIKLLKEGFDNTELRERFMREARSAGRLRHINIVTIFDVGEHDGQPFIAMEYVEGETLDALIKRRAPLSIARRIQLMDELCAGLQYAHRGGIVHRDIKPKNVMLDVDGVLKVLDFGIARVNDAGGVKTQAGMLMGTLNYMSPEQMMGLPDIDARADMFSAGAVFYELLTYRQAFTGGLESGILHKIINVNPEPMLSVDPRLDPGLVAIVEKCLEKSKERRYPDMAAVRRELAITRRRLGVDIEEGGADETVGGYRPPTVDEGTPRPGRRDSSRQELARLRAAQIRTHLDDARKALDHGDFTAALEASQRALLLNGDEPDAIAYEQRARAALDERQAQQLLAEARSELDRGALTAASLLVGRAESLSPASREAAAVRAELDAARRALAEQQARARALEAAIERARNALGAGSLDDAAARLAEALAIDADNVEARGIERELEAAVAARRRAEEQARADATMQAAREQFAAGRLDEAIAQLEAFQPAALVANTLGELQIERSEILRRRREAERLAEERRRAAEAAERKRQETERRLADATAKFDAQQFDRAQALVRDILREQPDLAEARALDDRIAAAIERAAEEERQRAQRAEEERQRTERAAAEERKRAERAAAEAAERQRAAEQAALERRRAEERAVEQKRLEEQRLAAQRVEEQKRREAEQAAKRTEDEKRQRDAERAAKRAAEQARAAGEAQRAAETSDATIVRRIDTNATIGGSPAPQEGDDATILLQRLPQSPGMATDEPGQSGRTGKYVVAAAAVILVAAVATWLFGTRASRVNTSEPPAAVQAAPGNVVLDVAPWANIVAVTRKRDGNTVSTGCTVTPCVASLPAGEYHVKATNPNFPTALEFDVSVEAGALREVRQTIPGFKPQDEVERILDR